MKIKGMHHCAIICSNYPQSKHFYADILQLKILNETYRAERHSYKLDLALPDGSQIELFSFPTPPKRVDNPEALGLRHLAFCVDNIEEEVAYLISKNVDVEAIRVDEISNKKYTFFKDPDLLPLEIYES